MRPIRGATSYQSWKAGTLLGSAGISMIIFWIAARADDGCKADTEIMHKNVHGGTGTATIPRACYAE